jgi:hypothetical protein
VQLLALCCPSALCPADPQAAPPYTTQLSNVTFFLNTTPVTFGEAEEACQLSGGHLATFESTEEQQEVEQHYVDQGWFLSPCHKWVLQLPACCLPAAHLCAAAATGGSGLVPAIGRIALWSTCGTGVSPRCLCST